jgi:hypothetical protein
MLEKKRSFVSAEIAADGTLFVKEYEHIFIDGELQKDIAPKIWRNCHYPSADLSKVPDAARSVAQAVWTPEVVQAHKDKLESARAAEEARLRAKGLNLDGSPIKKA